MEKITSVQMDKHKISLCVHIRKKYFGADTRPSTGMCMIVFAIPLLIPGIVITAVAFEDETGFSRFSGLHVFGIVLLATDLLLLVAGIALCIRFQSKVVPDEAFQAVSTHKKIRKEVKLDTVTTTSPDEPPHNSTDFSAKCYPSIPPVNYFLDRDFNNTNHEQSQPADPAFSSLYQQGFTKQYHSKENCEGDSSSDESYESDDCSSGSYIITENVVADRTTHEMGSERDLTKVQRPDFNFKNITTTMAQSRVVGSNNYFQSHIEDTDQGINEKVNSKVHHSMQNNTVLETHNDNVQQEISSHLNDSEIISAHTSLEVEPASDIHNTNCSPMSRRRLLGLGSESVLTSPKINTDSATSPVPSQLVFTQQPVSPEENVADSRTSVFSVATELREMPTKQNDNTGKKDNLFWCKERNQNSSFINSPYSARPISFPSRDTLATSTHPSIGTTKSSQKHPPRPQSTEGCIGSTKAMATMNPMDV